MLEPPRRLLSCVAAACLAGGLLGCRAAPAPPAPVASAPAVDPAEPTLADPLPEALLAQANLEESRAARRPLTIEARDEDLADLLERIGRRVGRNILVDPAIQETVTISLRDVSWRQAVDLLAERTGCTVEQRCGVLLLTRPPRLTIHDAGHANIRTVLQLLAAYAGKNIVIHPAVQGRLPDDVDLRDVEYSAALAQLVALMGDYVLLEDEDLLYVVPRDRVRRDLETVVIPLGHTRPRPRYRACPPGSALVR